MSAKRKPVAELAEPVPRGLTIEEFLAFAATRPNEEHWELIDGEPVLSPSPVDYHQVVASNLCYLLTRHKAEHGASWFVMLGIGTRSPAVVRGLLEPDVLVKANPPTGSPVTSDCLVAFEVMSRSNAKADQAWRQSFYTSIPNCQHYVTIGIKKPDVVVLSRKSGWKPMRHTRLTQSIDLPALGVSLSLADIYRWTNVAAK